VLQSGVEPIYRRSIDMRLAVLFASVAMFSTSSAPADPPAASSTPPSAAAAQPASNANDPNKVVCRSQAAKIGSRLGATRECRTQREWDEISTQDRREVEKMQATGMGSSGH
jgi:hypothetical protein